MIFFGIIGLLLISYALWIKSEKTQDRIFILGGFFLLAYSIHINDPIFIFLQVVFIVSASVELAKLKKK